MMAPSRSSHLPDLFAAGQQPPPDTPDDSPAGIVIHDGPPYTSAEVGHLLGVTARTIRRIPRDDLPWLALGPRGSRRYPRRGVFDYLARQLDPAQVTDNGRRT
jgi:hypothetical protein